MSDHTHECRDCRAEIPGGVQCEGGDASSECGWPGGNTGCACSCLDARGDTSDCEGPVEYRMPLSGTGMAFRRCDKHWAKRLDVQQGINERYPDSPFAPAGFDESYAGERWNDDY